MDFRQETCLNIFYSGNQVFRANGQMRRMINTAPLVKEQYLRTLVLDA